MENKWILQTNANATKTFSLHLRFIFGTIKEEMG